VSETLEQRVRRLEDRLAISDLVVKYATLLDDAQWDALGELCTNDGVFGSPHSTTEGRAAVVENFRVKHAPFTWTWHDPHGHAVEFDDDDHARGTVIGYAELGNDDTTVVTSIRRTVLSLYGLTLDDKGTGGLLAHERKRWPGREPEPAELPDVQRRYAGYPG